MSIGWENEISRNKFWISFYKQQIIICKNTVEVKKYLIKKISSLKKAPYINNLYFINYVKAAANSINPEYASFIDKILILI